MDKEKYRVINKKVIVSGIVQGVGFRPLTFRVAHQHDIFGTVQNIGGMVEIITQSTKQDFEEFLNDLKTTECEGCEIINIEIQDLITTQVEVYTEFKIIESISNDEISIIPPDLATCDNCKKELHNNRDRRFKNPFISCMSCGPRYTIIEKLPYDRNNTTMEDFAMCATCNEEYTSPESRRFHAQTISCDDCGPYLILYEFNNVERENDGINNNIINSNEINSNKINSNKINSNEANNNKINNYEINNNEIRNNEINNNEIRNQEIGNHKIRNQEIGNHEIRDQEIGNEQPSNVQAFEKAVKIINEGGIIAVKGIGGYHFACSPFKEETVHNLRKLKGREEKPFAVMFESVQAIRKYCEVSNEEQMLLISKARPIVLLYSDNKKMAKSTYKNSIYCGAFLPYTPLQIMLIEECGPLIMTSANISNKPIIKEDSEILSIRTSLLQAVLYNKRRIIRSVDDSVAKVFDKKAQLIRRSRGYVPYPVFLPQDDNLNSSNKNLKIFAAGGDLKAAFCLYNKGSAVVSQYFGDLEEKTIFDDYKESVEDLSHLLKIVPDIAICDLHPNYFSSRYVQTLGIPVIYVQHHHAHIASVMAEHNLKERVIGIAFDGTGYGTDGNIWGSEFMVCNGADYNRVAHLKYTPILGGDQSMRDAKKTATCYLLNAGLFEFINDNRSDIIKAAIKNNINTVLSSSMGRLFDVIACLLGIQDENHYEGECASDLEREAVLAEKNSIAPQKISFIINQIEGMTEIDPLPILESICKLRGQVDTGSLALGFHYAIADVVLKICEKIRLEQKINIVAISGGVFQNTLLSERVLKVLRDNKFQVYYNISVPPNDGSISLGQTYIGLMK